MKEESEKKRVHRPATDPTDVRESAGDGDRVFFLLLPDEVLEESFLCRFVSLGPTRVSDLRSDSLCPIVERCLLFCRDDCDDDGEDGARVDDLWWTKDAVVR